MIPAHIIALLGLKPQVECTAGTSAIPDLSDISGGGTTARVGARWGSNLNVYSRTATIVWTDLGDDWNGNCANNRYEGRWNLLSGDAPTSSAGADGVWHDMTTDVWISYDTPVPGSLAGTFNFELRRKSGGAVILTDEFIMAATEI